MSKINTLNYNGINWEEIFYYDESSASGLRRKFTSGGKAKDSVVGKMHYQASSGNPSAWIAKYKGVLYQVHRIIWVLNFGEISNDKYINHIDNNPFNNNLSNLELCTPSENNRRCSHHTGRGNQKNNTTGTNGVSFSGNRSNGRSYFIANWRDENGNHIKQYFPIKKLGKEIALSMAIRCRNDAIAELNFKGLGYPEKGNL